MTKGWLMIGRVTGVRAVAAADPEAALRLGGRPLGRVDLRVDYRFAGSELRTNDLMMQKLRCFQWAFYREEEIDG
jgi:hypothetical protein